MLQIVLAAITFILNGYMGLLVLFRNSKSWTNRFFFTLTLFINGYVITNYISLHPPLNTPENQLFWIRIVMAEASFLGPTLVLLVHTFPQANIRMKLSKRIPLIAFSCLSFILCLSPFVFTSISYPNGQPVPNPGPAIPIFFIDFAGLFLFSFALLIYKYRKSRGREKIQHFYFLAGIIATFSLMTISTLFSVVLFKTSALVFLGPTYAIFLVGFIAYAIVRHQFLDIRLVVARTVSFTILISLFAFIYSLFFTTLLGILTNTKLSTPVIVLANILTLIIAFSLQTIRRFIEKITDSIFYRNQYDTNKLLYDLTVIMASTVRLESLTHHLLEPLLSQMKISRGAFVLVENHKIYQVAHEGFAKAPDFEEQKILTLMNQPKTIVFEELPENDIKSIMRDFDITLAVALRTEGEQIGLLLFGEKLSGDIYTVQDIQVIEIFAPEAAIAIQNSISYEEIRRFNVTLQEKVNLATKDLQTANQRLQAMDKLKDEFISVASHELRTPMTAVKSYLWMIINKPTSLDIHKQKQYLDRAYNATNRLINLVNDMLNVSRIESGRIKLLPDSISIIDLAKEVVDELSAKAVEKKLHLLVEHPQVPNVFVDKDKTQEVLTNLIGNAMKFTPEGGTIKVSFKESIGAVETSVSDTGRGIKQEDISRLFKKFERLENTLTSVAETEGTGLGLFICKQFVELSGGKIWVTSEYGKGTTFTFSLPIASHQKKEASDATPIPLLPAASS